MKKNTLLITFFLVCLINYAQVKIGDNSFDLSPFSILELESSDKALLIPRMTTEQRDLSFDQTAPVGLIIFNITTQGFEYFYETPEAEKKWRSIKGLEIYTEIDRPEGGSSGDSYYDPETNTLYAWNSITNMWMPINAVSNNQIVIGDVNPEVGINPVDLMSGIIYYNSLTRGLFITSDTDGDGVYDEWKRVPTRGPTGRPGPEGPPGKNGVAISGRGAPNPNNVPNPIPGDVYVDILTGDIYTYTTNLTWERQTIIVTQLTQDTTTGVITYTDEVGGTSSATVTSLNVDNLLTTGLDGGTLLTSNTLNDALTSVSTVTISEIVSSTLLSSTIQNLETTTVLTQDTNNGVITYTDEDGVTTTATVTSFDTSNLLITGTDGGTLLTSDTLNNALTSVSTNTITQIVSATLTRETIQNLETTTVLTQDTNNGVITYTDEDGLTATATVTSFDSGNVITTGSDGGSYISSSSLADIIANSSVSTETITQLISDTLTRETIQNLETTTVLTQDTNNGVITYTDEDGGTATATVTSLDTDNLLITGTDGGTLLDAATLNNALTAVSTNTITQIVSSTLTRETIQNLETTTVLTQDTNNGVITYTDEDGGTATATVTSLDTENLLITGTDGGTLLDAATLNNALTAVSTNTITQIVSSTLTRETIQNLETTTDLTQDTNNGVITYTDEDGASATATVTSLDTENLLITGTDGGTLLDATTLNNALTAVSTTTITEIVSSTLTSSTVRALETVTTLSVTNTSEFTYTNEQGTEVNFITSKKGSGDPNENNVYGKPGDIYTDTDNGHLYTSDGTIWHAYQVITPYRGSIIDKQIYIAEYAWDAAFVIAGCFEFRLKEYSRNNPPPTGAEFRSGFNNEAMPEFRLAQDISSNVRVNYHIGQYTNGNFYAYSALSTEFTSLNDRTWVHMAPNNLDGMEPRERNEVWLSYPGDPIIYKINFTIITIDDLPISDETKTSVYSIVVERY